MAKSYGGAEVRIVETIQLLSQKIKCGVAVLEGSPLHLKLLEINCTVHPLPYKRYDIRLPFSIARIIKKNKYSLIDTQNPQSNLWGLIGGKMANISRTVTTVHSSVDETVSLLKTCFYNNILRLMYWVNTDFIAVSYSVRDYLIGIGIAESRINMVSNGIDTNYTYIKAPLSLKERIGWSSENFVIIVVGRLEPIKGHSYLITAFAEIKERFPFVRCLIAGVGREKERLESQVAELGLSETVHFAGFCDNIRDILHEVDAFCMPSLSEGLPFALLEACAARVPVVCTRVGGVAEFLKNGQSAVLVAPKSADGLISGITQIIDHPVAAKQRAEVAFTKVHKEFSIQKTVSQMIGIYKDKME
ncbi:MAG: glycosyltransferase family 4 protein [Desulfotalea sp.]